MNSLDREIFKSNNPGNNAPTSALPQLILNNSDDISIDPIVLRTMSHDHNKFLAKKSSSG